MRQAVVIQFVVPGSVSACPITHNSLQFLIATTDFVAFVYSVCQEPKTFLSILSHAIIKTVRLQVNAIQYIFIQADIIRMTV